MGKEVDSSKYIDRAEVILVKFRDVLMTKDIYVTQLLMGGIIDSPYLKKPNPDYEYNIVKILEYWNNRTTKCILDDFILDEYRGDDYIKRELETVVESYIPDGYYDITNIFSILSTLATQSFISKVIVYLDEENELDSAVEFLKDMSFGDRISFIDTKIPLEEILSTNNITTYITNDVEDITSLDLSKIEGKSELAILVCDYGFNMTETEEGSYSIKYLISDMPKSDNFEALSLLSVNVWDRDTIIENESVG